MPPVSTHTTPLPETHKLDIATALTTPTIQNSSVATSASTDSSQPHTPVNLTDSPQPTDFRLARLPVPDSAKLIQLLEKSKRVATVKKADAERQSLVTALTNARDPAVLTRVVERYMPYALTLWDVAQNLKAKGINVTNAIVWTSGLNHLSHAAVQFRGDFGLEAAMVLSLHAVNKLSAVLETDTEFAMQAEQVLVEHIRALQIAAGVFAYLRDTLAPTAIADFVGTPPPELHPHTASMFYSLSLCLAQTLHIRRAAVSGMNAAILAKLSVAAHDLAKQVQAKYEACVTAGISLSNSIKATISDINLLSRGWVFQYVGLSTTAEKAGAKISALKAANEALQLASKSSIVGKVAAADLAMLKKELDDAVRANTIVYQNAIPDADDLPLPPGRALGSATKFEAARIPASDAATQ